MKTKNLDLLLIFAVFMVLSYVIMLKVALSPNFNLQMVKGVIIGSYFLFFYFLFKEVIKRNKENILLNGSEKNELESKNQFRAARILIILGVISICISMVLVLIGSSGPSEFIVGICGILSGYLIKKNI